MAQAKVDLKVGSLSFSGEADSTWLEKQLDKLLEYARTAPAGDVDQDENGERQSAARSNKVPLGVFLKSKNATSNQNRKFLATACWLRTQGTEDPTTSAVTKALSDQKQMPIGNPAQCLNNNVSKGFCVKKGKGFYITEQGTADIG
jgi:hypothetical protein